MKKTDIAFGALTLDNTVQLHWMISKRLDTDAAKKILRDYYGKDIAEMLTGKDNDLPDGLRADGFVYGLANKGVIFMYLYDNKKSTIVHELIHVLFRYSIVTQCPITPNAEEWVARFYESMYVEVTAKDSAKVYSEEDIIIHNKHMEALK